MCVQCTTLNRPKSLMEPLFLVGVAPVRFNGGRCAMGIALEVNFAPWIMIGCGLAELAQAIGYLN
jgi:hypothetical protein